MKKRKSSLSVLLIAVMVSMTVLSSFQYVFAEAPALGVIDVEGGQIEGVAADVEGVTVFKGVPFAAPPVGENRWKAPQPIIPWEGVKTCDTWANGAMQMEVPNPVGTFWGDEFYFDPEYDVAPSEDCLYLNVYTPAASGDEELPVLVWIHGGGFDHGHASEMEFNASKLAEKGIVVVCIQYRLGAFGYLALPELSAENENGVSGNYGLLDQVESLKWVQNNISAFGGDPNAVTICGQSAGAMSVRGVLSTTLADGLYQRAIIQSGFSGILTTEENRNNVYTSLEKKEQSGQETVESFFGEDITLEKLREIPAEEFVNTENGAFSAFKSASGNMTQDGYVLTEESVDLMAEGALDGIDIMIGGTADENTSLADVSNPSLSIDTFQTNMKNTYGSLYDECIYDAQTEREAFEMNLRIRSDNAMALYRLSAAYINANNNTNAYAYYFNQKLPNHADLVRDEDIYGAFHSAELWYMFNSIRNVEGQRVWRDQDYELADTMTSYWANFVKTGDPNGEGLATWEKCSNTSNLSFMEFSNGQAFSTTETEYPARDNLFLAYNRNNLGLQTGSYSLVVEGFDWGPGVSKSILNAGEIMTEVDKDDFTAYVYREDTMWDTEGERTITNAYVSDADGNPVDSGTYITIEMQVGPNIGIGSPFFYNPFVGLNVWVTCDYTFTKASTGATWTVQTGLQSLIADDFTTGNITYEDITMTYAAYDPPTDDKQNPLVIWLHGAGEGGTDPSVTLLGNKVVNLATDDIQNIFDGAYILTPQVPTMWMDNGTGSYTTDGTSMYPEALMHLIQTYVSNNSDVDTNRIYIGGCSNGGFMTMKMLLTYPNYFAAAYPVCEAYQDAWITDEQIESIKNIPIWFTHAANDPTVGVATTVIPTYERLIAAGAKNVHLTMWDEVRDTTGLYKNEDGTPYSYNGHWSWLYTLNNQCTLDYDGTPVQINGKDVTIMEWLSAQSYTALNTKLLQFAVNYAENVKAEGGLNGVITVVSNKFNSALDNGKALLEKAAVNDTQISQAELDKAAVDLFNIFQYLEFKVDKTDLQSLVDLVASFREKADEYTPATYMAFEQALTDAENVLADDAAMEEDVNEAWNALAQATANLRYKANKDKLQELLVKANAFDENAYTPDSFALFRTVVDEAQDVADDENAEQPEVDAQTAKLASAMDKPTSLLVPKSAGVDNSEPSTKTESEASKADTTKTDTTKDNEISAKTNANPKTGDEKPLAVLLLIVSVAGILITANKKRLQK